MAVAAGHCCQVAVDVTAAAAVAVAAVAVAAEAVAAEAVAEAVTEAVAEAPRAALAPGASSPRSFINCAKDGSSTS